MCTGSDSLSEVSRRVKRVRRPHKQSFAHGSTLLCRAEGENLSNHLAWKHIALQGREGRFKLMS